MLTGMFKKGVYLMFSGRLSKSLLLLLAGGVTYPQLQAKFDLYYNQDDPKNKEIIDKCPHIKWVSELIRAIDLNLQGVLLPYVLSRPRAIASLVRLDFEDIR